MRDEDELEIEENNMTIVFSVVDKKLQNGVISLTVIGYESCLCNKHEEDEFVVFSRIGREH